MGQGTLSQQNLQLLLLLASYLVQTRPTASLRVHLADLVDDVLFEFNRCLIWVLLVQSIFQIRLALM